MESVKPYPTEAAHFFIDGENECQVIANHDYWIPFQSTSIEKEFQVVEFSFDHHDFKRLTFNAYPSVLTLKVTLLRVLLHASPVNSDKLLKHLWPFSHTERKQLIFRLVEEVYFLRSVLVDRPDRDDLCISIFELHYYQCVSKLDLLRDIIFEELSSFTLERYDVPKWKGRSMQFIEFISIGIELDLFEGENQNHICNSLLKAFQVQAESDQPIYKQRFNALFKRSKIHLPLIAEYIRRVEDAKQIKLEFVNK